MYRYNKDLKRSRSRERGVMMKYLRESELKKKKKKKTFWEIDYIDAMIIEFGHIHK